MTIEIRATDRDGAVHSELYELLETSDNILKIAPRKLAVIARKLEKDPANAGASPDELFARFSNLLDDEGIEFHIIEPEVSFSFTLS
jgi:hypothetical protein